MAVLAAAGPTAAQALKPEALSAAGGAIAQTVEAASPMVANAMREMRLARRDTLRLIRPSTQFEMGNGDRNPWVWAVIALALAAVVGVGYLAYSSYRKAVALAGRVTAPFTSAADSIMGVGRAAATAASGPAGAARVAGAGATRAAGEVASAAQTVADTVDSVRREAERAASSLTGIWR